VNSHNGRGGLAHWLAGVAAGDPAVLASGIAPEADNIEESGLDMRTHALVRLAAAVAAGEPGESYDRHLAAALDQGVTLDEIIGVLVALLPTVGAARVTEAAPAVLGAIGRVAPDLPAPPRSGRCLP
jgi:4-carboxymuconolactone decarboxylase